MIRSITLLGSSSGRNAGDAALIAGIMDSIDARLGRRLRYEIPTINSRFIRETYPNDTIPVSMMPWHLSVKMLGLPVFRSVLRTDLTLVFDAVLFDRALYNPLFNFMSTLYLLLPYAKKRGSRYGLFNIGAGPVDTAAGREMLRKIADGADFVTVRDEASRKLLLDVGSGNPRLQVAADSALTVRMSGESRIDEITHALGISEADEVFAVNINAYLDTWARPRRPSMGKEAFLSVYAEAINNFLAATGAALVVVSTQHHDVPISNELLSRVVSPKKALLSNTEYNHYDIKGFFSRVSLHFGMRLHATILSASALAPTIGIAYQPKVAFFFETLEMSNLCISFDDFSAGTLTRHMLQSWENRKLIRERLERIIPVLQDRADSSTAFVEAMDGERSSDEIAAASERSGVASG